VFVPNPVQSLGDQSLTDRKDADAAVPAAAYHDVTLTNLDGGGFLHGDYATVVSETGNLGFGETRRAINNRPQAVRINQLGYDNSFATDHPKNELRFGKGGVDDAEDGEVILHEYGHAIHFAQNFSFASEQAGAISEGFGDYWAVTVGDVVSRSLGVPARAPLPASPTGRRLLHQHGPALPAPGRPGPALPGRPQRRGAPRRPDLVAALWDIRQALGNVRADTVVLEGSFDFPGTTMPELARRTVAAARRLYGDAAATAVTRAFADRGIL